MNKMEALAVEWTVAAIGWLLAIAGAIVGWAVREAIIKRLDIMETRMQANAQRLQSLETLATAAATHIDLTKSVDGLREEIRATRLEIKQDVRQLLDLMKS